MKKAEVTVTFEIKDNFYEDEKFDEKQKIKKYEEDFEDIEVLTNYLQNIRYKAKVKLK